MTKYAALAAMLALTGCASITGEKIQPLSVITVLDNKEVAGIGCTLSNDAGSWFLTSPASVTVHKSTGDLAIDCKKEGLAGNATVVSKANGGAWGNILAGGVIGYVVDRQTGAGFNYPSNVTIMLRQIENAQQVQSQATPAAIPAAPAAPAAAAPQAAKPAAAPAAAPQLAAATAKPVAPAIPAAAGNPFVEGTMAEANPAAQR
ncbi:hypothetical protein [Pseudoduganella rivuli]|uniref:hypothetical protein n=1 Tax=Pseudoduganella rivuli TaxID=2666085 RepID=UPI0018A1FB46|nr:hypothetical protein [Pseudoduganella rivuli]